MTVFIFRPSRLGDSHTMVPRQEDIEEWDASFAGGIKANLEDSIRSSLIYGECLTVEDGDSNLPLVIVGALPDAHGTVHTWMVMAAGSEPKALAMMYHHKDEVDGFFERWPNTVCYTHHKNLVHHRWLAYVGYRVTGVNRAGPLSELFYQFTKGII